jgi:dephospho-CoA kinase
LAANQALAHQQPLSKPAIGRSPILANPSYNEVTTAMEFTMRFLKCSASVLSLNRVKVPLLITLLIFILPLSGCRRGSSLVAEVGTLKISESDVELRQKVIQTYNPNEKRELGQKQLIDAFVKAEILRLWDNPISQDELKAEKERINKSTMMPGKLEEIRNLFSTEKQYLKVFVLPVLAKRKIYYEFFLKSEKVHKDSLKQAKAFLAPLIKKPAQFEKLAEDNGKMISAFRLNAQGFTWGKANQPNFFKDKTTSEIYEQILSRQASSSSQHAKTWNDQIVKKLKNGEVFHEVVDDETRWLVVRLIKKQDMERGHLFQAVIFPKLDFAHWLKQQREKIDIKVYH